MGAGGVAAIAREEIVKKIADLMAAAFHVISHAIKELVRVVIRSLKTRAVSAG